MINGNAKVTSIAILRRSPQSSYPDTRGVAPYHEAGNGHGQNHVDQNAVHPGAARLRKTVSLSMMFASGTRPPSGVNESCQLLMRRNSRRS
mgnify:CR=1 FL=1